MQEQPKLVGCRPGTGRAIRRQMGLPGLDMVFGTAAPAIDILVEPRALRLLRLVTTKRVSGPSAPASTRAMIRSTRLQLCAPSKNSMKRRSLPSRGAASNLAFVLASRPSTWRRNVAVGGDAEDVISPLARHQSRTSGPQ